MESGNQGDLEIILERNESGRNSASPVNYARIYPKKSNRYLKVAIFSSLLSLLFGLGCMGHRLFKNSMANINFSSPIKAYPHDGRVYTTEIDGEFGFYCKSDLGRISSVYIIDKDGNKTTLGDNINDRSYIGVFPPNLKSGVYKFGMKLENGKEWTDYLRYDMDFSTGDYDTIFDK